MRRLLLPLIAAAVATPLLAAPAALADGCYICTRGSVCGSYCRYAGKDTWNNRKKCRKAGCRIGGTASCPVGVNIKVCTGSLQQHGWRYAAAGSTPFRRTHSVGNTGFHQCLPR